MRRERKRDLRARGDQQRDRHSDQMPVRLNLTACLVHDRARMLQDFIGVHNCLTHRRPRCKSGNTSLTASSHGLRALENTPSLEADDKKIGSFPSVRLWPVEREVHAVSDAQIKRLKVRHMDAQRRVACRGIVHGAPVIDAPMHDGRSERLDAKGSARRHRAHLVVEAPDDVAQTSPSPRGTAERSEAADRRSPRLEGIGTA